MGGESGWTKLEEWMRDLRFAFVLHSRLPINEIGPYMLAVGAESWRKCYEDGMTPKDALLAAVEHVEPPQEPAKSYTKDEWRLLCIRAKPDLTEGAFEKLWLARTLALRRAEIHNDAMWQR